MTIVSGIFLIPLQKAQVFNLILALVLSALLEESLLLLFRKGKLSTCNQNVHTQTIQFPCFVSCSFMVKRCGLLLLLFFSLLIRQNVKSNTETGWVCPGLRDHKDCRLVGQGYCSLLSLQGRHTEEVIFIRLEITSSPSPITSLHFWCNIIDIVQENFHLFLALRSVWNVSFLNCIPSLTGAPALVILALLPKDAEKVALPLPGSFFWAIILN